MNRFGAMRFLLALGLFPAVGACAGVSRVRSLPHDAGLEAHYIASQETTLAALPAALSAARQRVVTRSDTGSTTDTVIGLRGANLMTWGEVSRVLVEGHPPEGSTVRVAARSRYLLDWSNHSERSALKIVEALDRDMGATRIAPFEGLRIRGVRGDGMEVRGVVGRGPDGSFTLTQPPPGQDPIPLSGLHSLAAHRGSFGHGSEGALIGGVVGLALVLSQAFEPLDCATYDSCVISALLYPNVGILVGYLVGTGVRTHVWSPMDLSPTR